MFISSPSLWMRRLRFREVRQLSQNQTANGWHRQDLSPHLCLQSPVLVLPKFYCFFYIPRQIKLWCLFFTCFCVLWEYHSSYWNKNSVTCLIELKQLAIQFKILIEQWSRFCGLEGGLFSFNRARCSLSPTLCCLWQLSLSFAKIYEIFSALQRIEPMT